MGVYDQKSPRSQRYQQRMGRQQGPSWGDFLAWKARRAQQAPRPDATYWLSVLGMQPDAGWRLQRDPAIMQRYGITGPELDRQLARPSVPIVDMRDINDRIRAEDRMMLERAQNQDLLPVGSYTKRLGW